MQSSPGSPCGISLSGSSSEMIRTSVSGIGRPIEPGRPRPSIGFTWVTGEHSVRPYPSTSTAPSLTSANRRATACGNGAAPDTHALTDLRSNFCTSGNSLIATYNRGTPGKNVGFSSCEISRIRWMSRGFGTGTSFAAIRPVRTIASSPYEWKYGIAARTASRPSSIVVSHAQACRAFAHRFAWDNIAPLAIPVVPPV